MNINRVVIATIMRNGVFRRFAQLSDEDKAAIIEKVKEKLQEKAEGTEEPAAEPAEETPESTEEVSQEVKELPSTEELNQILNEVLDGTDLSGNQEEANTTADEEESQEEGQQTTEEGDSLNNMVDELAQEVENVRADGEVTPSEVMGLFDNMMRMVTMLLNARPPSKPRKKKASVDQDKIVSSVLYEKIAERVASRGFQTQRKDKDLMSDTGGISKGRNKEPEQKPPRTDSTVRYRTKRKTRDQKDCDTDSNKDEEV